MAEAKIMGLGAPTAREVQVAKRTKALAADDLHSVRRTAEGWRNAEVISASVALAATFISGPETFEKLDDPMRTIVGLALALVFVLAAFSVGLAVRASVGWPTWVQARTPLALENWEREEVGNIARYVRISMILGGVVALILGLVISAVLVVPSKAPELATLTTVDGRVYCVSQLRQEGNDFAVTVSGTELVVPGNMVTKVNEVDKCPT